MKMLKSVIGILTLSSTLLLFHSCSSVPRTSETAKEDNEFFDPSTTAVKKHDSRTAESKIVEQQAPQQKVKSDSTVTENVFAENERLKNILGQMRATDGQLWQKSDALNDLERSASAMAEKRALASNLELIELLKEQNARLIDVLEQLKSMVSQQSLASKAEQKRTQAGLSNEQLNGESDIDMKLAYSRAIRAYQDHRFGAAITQFWKIIASKKSRELSNNSRFWLGVSYFNLGRYGDALPLFKRLLTIRGFDKSESTYIMLGQCYEQMGNRMLARTTYEELMRLNPTCDLAQIAQFKISML